MSGGEPLSDCSSGNCHQDERACSGPLHTGTGIQQNLGSSTNSDQASQQKLIQPAQRTVAAGGEAAVRTGGEQSRLGGGGGGGSDQQQGAGGVCSAHSRTSSSSSGEKFETGTWGVHCVSKSCLPRKVNGITRIFAKCTKLTALINLPYRNRVTSSQK